MSLAHSSVSSAWSLSMPFWNGKERWRAAGLLAAIVVLNLCLVAIAVLLTFWQRAFYNSLEARNWDAFVSLLLAWYDTKDLGFIPGFGPILAVYVLFTTYALYLKQALQIRWRSWMTSDLLKQWFRGQAYYKMSLGKNGADNPDQRISEDVDLFVESTLSLSLGFMTALVSLLSFVVLLWTLSDTVQIFGMAFPGSLVWLALIYALSGTAITHFLGSRLIGLNFHQQKTEADFRFSLVRLRENAEGIAFYQGEKNEAADLDQRFSRLAKNWREIMNVTKRMTFFASGYSQAALVFPFAIIAPAYFAGRTTLGGIFQTANAFVKVQEALSWIVDNYSKIAEWSATVTRLKGFVEAVRSSNAAGEGPRIIRSGNDALSINAFTLALPDGKTLLRDLDVEISCGERVLIRGASGAGKSTLLRALAGLWPHASGELHIPMERRMFLPQKSYIPTGALIRAVAYPLDNSMVSVPQVEAALEHSGLPHLVGRLDWEDAWASRLSGGEVQRLALARTLLFRPDWLFLDEATANLDPDGEAMFYRLLAERFPQATLVSVAHRPQVEQFHSRILTLQEGELLERLCQRNPS